RLDDGRVVRAVAYVRQLYDSGRTEEVVVAVAKTEGSRDAMVWHLLRPQLFGEVLTLLLAMLAAQIQYARQRDNPDRSLAEALAGMHKSSRKLTTLTNKLLLLAQAESAASSSAHERVDLSALIAGVLEELIAFAQSHEIALGE